MKDGFWISLNWDLNSCIPKKKGWFIGKFKQKKIVDFLFIKI